MTDLRVLALDDGLEPPYDGSGADPGPGTVPGPISALGPPCEPTEDAGVLDDVMSPYYAGEWRGAALYQCPAGDFPGRSHRAVVRHMAAAHPAPPERDVASRARQAGIILPRGI